MPPLVDQNSQSEVVSTTVSTTCGLLYAISKAMEEEVAQGDIAAETADAFAPLSVSIFDGNAAPSITISSYLERLSAYMHCSIECFLLALPLLARVLRAATDTSSLNPSDPGGPGHFHLHSRSAHRLLGTAVVIAAKFHEEAPRKNAYYATVVGVPLHELNKLEVAFLNALSFNVYVPLIELERWRDRVAWTVVDSALQLGAWEVRTVLFLPPPLPPRVFSDLPTPHTPWVTKIG